MGVFTDHPHTAITTKINSIIENDLEPDIELPDLLDIISLQYSGATEAARAIRKKLKYGQLNEQIGSLDLLNALVLNGGRELTELYNDRKLLERLKESANDTTINTKIRKKIIVLAIYWNENFKDSSSHAGIAKLKNQLPKVTRKKKERSSRRHFMDDEAYYSDDNNDDEEEEEEEERPRRVQAKRPHASKSSSAKSNAAANRKYNIPTINIKKEGPKIKLLISEASTASTDLINALKTVKRDQGELSTDNRRATVLFDKTRIIRKKILRYLQLTDSEEFLGSLIHANEELVNALQRYTEFSLQEDSDEYSSLSGSESDSDLQSVTDSLASSMIDAHARRFPTKTRAAPGIPAGRTDSRADSREDNPFGDVNEVDDAADWR